MQLVTYFEPQPPPSDVPARMPSPFGAAHPLARAAAERVIRELSPELRRELDAPGGGKMFGVLVVAARDGRIGFLRAFSGMLAGSWHAPGFVPPAFDAAQRDATWPAGEAELAAIDRELRAFVDGDAHRDALARHAEVTARHASELAASRDEHAARKQRRDEVRASLASDADAVHARLADESRRDGAGRKRLLAAHATERAAAADALRVTASQIAALEALRADRSRYWLQVLFDTYALANARGERKSLCDVFAPDMPPGGAGDCAAPKLLAAAYARGLRPIAFAEVWCGAPPATGGRHSGTFYPACRGKCGPILAHMLDGLDVEAAPVFGADAAGEPRVVYEDDHVLVVDKPVGLLSVPGRSGALQDSVLTRLRAQHPALTVVHRLDLDTSGLLLAAKDAATHAALQRQFAAREVEKRYVAVLDGAPGDDGGVIDLALRVDLDDRPRQIHDPVHGKRAVTEWRVLDRTGARTRVALVPRTGRTHQLRVHAAHPLGLAAPIVGDRLYGREDRRLMLHAEALAFTHPHRGCRTALSSPAPF